MRPASLKAAYFRNSIRDPYILGPGADERTTLARRAAGRPGMECGSPDP